VFNWLAPQAVACQCMSLAHACLLPMRVRDARDTPTHHDRARYCYSQRAFFVCAETCMGKRHALPNNSTQRLERVERCMCTSNGTCTKTCTHPLTRTRASAWAHTPTHSHTQSPTQGAARLLLSANVHNKTLSFYEWLQDPVGCARVRAPESDAWQCEKKVDLLICCYCGVLMQDY
jgi:hypothetical protein